MLGAVVRMADRVDGEVFRWAVGGILGLVTTAGSFWLTHVNAQIEGLRKDFYERAQKYSALEAQVTAFDRRLERIEQKQDAILDKLSRK